MKPLVFLIGIAFFISYSLPAALADEDRSTFRIAKSDSTYIYFGKGQVCTPEAPGDRLTYKQSDFEVGIDTPRKKLGIFYFSAGVNFNTLIQEEQKRCVGFYEETAEVPEKAFLHVRELLLTLGVELGFFFLEGSMGQTEVRGNYYLNDVRYDAVQAFPYTKLNGILQFDLFSWGYYGLEASIASQVPQSLREPDEGETYIEYERLSLFIKILL